MLEHTVLLAMMTCWCVYSYKSSILDPADAEKESSDVFDVECTISFEAESMPRNN